MRLLLRVLLLVLVPLLVEAAHAGQGELMRRGTGWALAVLVDGLSSRGRITVQRRSPVSCRGVVVGSRRWIAHGLGNSILGRRVVMLLLLVLLAWRASGRRRMGHGRRRRGSSGWHAARKSSESSR